MKEFLSNSWVVSIISGIIVFLLTNTIIMIQNRRKHKKQISDANTMVLNRLRGYVVDNGLPQKDIINAVKSSTSREYNIKYDELLTIKELCEELITDIISNIYISNDNKVKYINMLKDFLNEKSNIEEKILNSKQTNDSIKKIIFNSRFEIITSIIASLSTVIGVFLASLNMPQKDLDKSLDVNSDIIAVVSFVFLSIIIISIFPILKDIIKRVKKHKK